MIAYKTASKDDLLLLMKSRLEMLKEVNSLSDDHIFDKEFVQRSSSYFQNADQTTVLAIDEDVIGCATMCYVDVMPTFDHPTGKRAHLMNVYTSSRYRGQGIASEMLDILLDEAKRKGVTEISLDATEAGRPLYKKFGFRDSEEYMVLNVGEVGIRR